MPRSKSRFSHLGMVAPPAVEGQDEVTAAAPADEAEVVQLNLKVSETLRQALRMKALRLGIPLTEALRPLLQAWADKE
jgi:hypothetical protein